MSDIVTDTTTDIALEAGGTERKGKHPDFDTCWEANKGLVWWVCTRVAKTFGGEAADYLGTYALRLNRCLYGFDPTKGKLTTYFMQRIYEDVLRNFLRYESETRALWWAKEHSTQEALKQLEVEYTFHEAGNMLYRVPEEDAEDMQHILDSFDTIAECWEFFCRGLDGKRRFVVECYYREGLTLEEIGDRLKISKERVRQLRNSALDRIRDRLKLVQRFTDLFQKRIDEN